ncbi:MAG TPA: VOC family protein [Solirubrobacteraceae bacterium]|nr:VOC family protein [Solirubrobacteraceae bacterium]
MLHHVALEVRPDDLDACVAFWALLGFERVEPPPSLAQRATWVERAGTQVHLMRADEPVAPPRGHAAVVADDYDEALGRLRAAGFEPEPREEHWGAARCFVRAPGGHRVEVMARPPASGA